MVWQFLPPYPGGKGRDDYSHGHHSHLLKQKSKTILYPKDYLPTTNAAQTEVIESFVRDLEAELGVKRTEVSLAEEWKKSRPVDVKEDDVAEYLKEVRDIPPTSEAIY
jgi:hypothetical protein